ncbi:MAG TPA: GNAT family N-acetyltransferase [Caulobacteraceae bacterium]
MELLLLASEDAWRLENVAPEVFDNPIDPATTEAFLADPRHHIAVAIEEDLVVGFASGVHYVHPDKPPELFINEVATAPTHQRRGLAKAVLGLLLEQGRALGCASAWVLTDSANAPAQALYASLGGALMPGQIVGFEYDLQTGRPSRARGG